MLSYIFALLSLYDATLERTFLSPCGTAHQRSCRPVSRFAPWAAFISAAQRRKRCFFTPKECYDGAIPSGNSLLAYVLVRVNALLPDQGMENILNKQLAYMSGEAERYPAGYSMFLMALSDFWEPPLLITAVPNGEHLNDLPFVLPSDAIVKVLEHPSEEYKLLNEETTFYVCRNHSCLPSMNKRQLMTEIRKQYQT